MGLRETIQEKQAVVAIVAVVLIAVGVFLMRGSERGKTSGIRYIYFYDLGSNELYATGLQTRPPAPAPSGSQGVKAYVYSCGKCTPSQQFIGYLESYSERDRQMLERGGDMPSDQAANLAAAIVPQVAAEPDKGAEPQWVPASTAEGRKITEAPSTRCDGIPARVCNP